MATIAPIAPAPPRALGSPLDGAARLLLTAVVVLEFFFAPRWLLWNAHFRPVDFGVLAAALFLVFRLAWERRWGAFIQEQKPLLTAFGGCLSACLACAVFSVSPPISLKEFLQMTEWFALAVVTVDAARAPGGAVFLRRLLFVILALAVFEAAWGCGQYIMGASDIRMEEIVRITGSLDNRLGSYLFLGFIVATAFLHGAPAGRAAPFVLTAGLLLAALILVQVRTLWVLLPFTALPVLAGDRRRNVLRWLCVLGTGSVFFFSVLGLGLKADDGAYLKTLSKRGFSSLTMRVEMWSSAARMFKAHPFVGVGPGNYSAVFREAPYASERLNALAHTMRLGDELDAHSGFFTRLAEMGLLGTGAFSTLFGYMLLLAARLRSKGWDALFLAAGMAICLSVASDLIGDWLGGNLFWVFIGMLWALSRPKAAGEGA